MHYGETYEQAAVRRARQELNIDIRALERILSFTYRAAFGPYSENEYALLLRGGVEGVISPNPEEVSEIRYITLKELSADVERESSAYTPWLKIALEKYLQNKGNITNLSS